MCAAWLLTVYLERRPDDERHREPDPWKPVHSGIIIPRSKTYGKKREDDNQKTGTASCAMYTWSRHSQSAAVIGQKARSVSYACLQYDLTHHGYGGYS